jgi:spore germination protein GerM
MPRSTKKYASKKAEPKGSGLTKFLLLLGLFAAAVAGFAVVKMVFPRHAAEHGTVVAGRESAAPTHGTEPPAASSGKSVKIYTVAASGPADENGLAPQEVVLPESTHPATDAVNALIAANPSPLPSGTSLRGLTVKHGLATVDFSAEFKKDFHGGDTAEAQAVNSLLLTLGQFRAIKRVRILVDGAPIDSIGGLLDLSAPLDVIRGTPTRQVAAEGGERHG